MGTGRPALMPGGRSRLAPASDTILGEGTVGVA